MPKISQFTFGEHVSATKLNRTRATLLSARDALGVEEQPNNYSARLRVPNVVAFFVCGGVPPPAPTELLLADCSAWHNINVIYYLVIVCARDDGGDFRVSSDYALWSGRGFYLTFPLEPPNQLYVKVNSANQLTITRDAAITNVWRVTLRVTVKL